MKIHDFFLKIEEEKKKNPHLRKGQIAFNLMMSIKPEKAEIVRGSNIDPFYNDSSIVKFFHFCFKE